VGFEDVINMMLSLITDYGFNGLSDVDLVEDCKIRVNMVLVRAGIDHITFDIDSEEFDDELTVMEATIIAYGLIMMWLSPTINNSEVLSTQLSSKEVTQFSNANRIQQGIALYKLAKTEFYQLVIDYDAKQTRNSIMEELGGM
jgi:hypothetical protein